MRGSFRKNAGAWTDWTAYYGKRRSRLSSYTQQFTLERILDAVDRYLGKEEKRGLEILELGGGGSCFAKNLCGMRNVAAYDIVDSNALAVRLFHEMEVPAGRCRGIRRDLLGQPAGGELSCRYDFVYSAGLVEHFRGKDIETMIGRHYECCRPGGVVMVTFPTPTRKYKAVRRCMEAVGAWQFYDERPIAYEEVGHVFEKYGTVLEHSVNKKLPLSQMVVVSRKPAAGAGLREGM